MEKKGHQSEQNTLTLTLKAELSTPLVKQIMIQQFFFFSLAGEFFNCLMPAKKYFGFYLLLVPTYDRKE